MATYQDTSGVSKAINDTIKEAREYLIIISPYLQISDKLRNSIQYTINSGVKTKILYGKKDPNHKESEWLFSIDGLEIRYLENLHAKCYLNEKSALITSMNLYKFSLENNYEMGISINRSEEEGTYELILRDADRLFSYGKQIKSKQQTNIVTPSIEKQSIYSECHNETTGYCIRCGDSIPLNPEKPYCNKCFKSWNKYKNPDYAEKYGYCHECGETYTVSFNEPYCDKCESKEKPSLIGSFLKNLKL